MSREFQPTIIATKEEMLAELRKGNFQTSKYNTLNEEEKLFVELIAFGGYPAETAMRCIRKGDYKYGQGNRMAAKKDVADTLEELTYQKNKKYMAEISSARDLALRKLMYIMNTTEDESVAAACAKTILDKSEKATTEKEAKNMINAIQFNIQAAPKTLDNPKNPKIDEDEPIIIDDVVIKDPEKPTSSGLEFSLNYQNVNNYDN